MEKRMIRMRFLVVFGLSLFLVGNVLAAGTVFNGTVSDDWNDAANWSAGLPGGNGDGGWEPLVMGDGANCVIYSGNTGTLSDHSQVYGGTFTLQAGATLQHANPADTSSYFSASIGATAGATLNFDGTANLGILRMDGRMATTANITGDVTISRSIDYPWEANTGQATINVNGGTLDIRGANFEFRAAGGSVLPVFNIAGGEVLVSGNITDIIDAINNPAQGIIQANGGAGTFAYDYTAGGDYTTITAVPEPATLTLLALGGLSLIRRKR